MNIAITGSRKVNSKDLVWFLLTHIIEKYNLTPSTLTSGGANGVDKLTEDYFLAKFDIKARVLKPEYDKYPPYLAPIMRNGDIVKGADWVIAIWEGVVYEGRTGGCRDAARKAYDLNIPVIFVNVARGSIDLFTPDNPTVNP